MSVWVLGSLAPHPLDSKGVNQALAAERMGSRTHLIATREMLGSADMTDGKVFLAHLGNPAGCSHAIFCDAGCAEVAERS